MIFLATMAKLIQTVVHRNARDWAKDHGGKWKELPYEDRNLDETTAANRDYTFAQYDAQHGGHQDSVEEYPPARHRDPNEETKLV